MNPHRALVNRQGSPSEQDYLRLERRVLLGARATLLMGRFESLEGIARDLEGDPCMLGQLAEVLELVRPDRARHGRSRS